MSPEDSEVRQVNQVEVDPPEMPFAGEEWIEEKSEFFVQASDLP